MSGNHHIDDGTVTIKWSYARVGGNGEFRSPSTLPGLLYRTGNWNNTGRLDFCQALFDGVAASWSPLGSVFGATDGIVVKLRRP